MGGGAVARLLIKRSFRLTGHGTSIALEPEFWAALDRMAESRGQTLAQLIVMEDCRRDPTRQLASFLRVSVLEWLESRASKSGA